MRICQIKSWLARIAVLRTHFARRLSETEEAISEMGRLEVLLAKTQASL